MKKIVILGSTGSIGVNSLKVIKELGADYSVVGLAAGSNWGLMRQQMGEFAPRIVAMSDDAAASKLASMQGEGRAKIVSGPEGLCEVASLAEADIVVAAITGSAGLASTLAALSSGKRVALANKEALVMAGSLMMERARARGAEIIPVDSEHSAIFQARMSGKKEDVARIFLTASGGPFINHEKERLKNVTPTDALKHPTWKMGEKISVDSATLMNKALEIIEARWLFDVKPSQIEVIVHPQSIVHSLVEFCDGSVIAQLGLPDMRVPIQYALTYPERVNGNVGRLDLTSVKNLTFQKPDMDKFPAVRLGYEAADLGGAMGAAMSVANETAVDAFLRKQCPFTKIVETVAYVMKEHKPIANPSLDDIMDVSRWAADVARYYLGLNERKTV